MGWGPVVVEGRRTCLLGMVYSGLLGSPIVLLLGCVCVTWQSSCSNEIETITYLLACLRIITVFSC